MSYLGFELRFNRDDSYWERVASIGKCYLNCELEEKLNFQRYDEYDVERIIDLKETIRDKLPKTYKEFIRIFFKDYINENENKEFINTGFNFSMRSLPDLPSSPKNFLELIKNLLYGKTNDLYIYTSTASRQLGDSGMSLAERIAFFTPTYEIMEFDIQSYIYYVLLHVRNNDKVWENHRKTFKVYNDDEQCYKILYDFLKNIKKYMSKEYRLCDVAKDLVVSINHLYKFSASFYIFTRDNLALRKKVYIYKKDDGYSEFQDIQYTLKDEYRQNSGGGENIEIYGGKGFYDLCSTTENLSFEGGQKKKTMFNKSLQDKFKTLIEKSKLDDVKNNKLKENEIKDYNIKKNLNSKYVYIINFLYDEEKKKSENSTLMASEIAENASKKLSFDRLKSDDFMNKLKKFIQDRPIKKRSKSKSKSK